MTFLLEKQTRWTKTTKHIQYITNKISSEKLVVFGGLGGKSAQANTKSSKEGKGIREVDVEPIVCAP